MSENIVEVEIFGNKYKIKQSEGDLDVKVIAEYFDSKISSVAQNAPTGSSLHLVVLAGLNICHELLELKDKDAESHKQTEEKLENLLKIIEAAQL